ncbi:uncharacterized protein LOC141914862 [Tubulanus polymorphus]|uniref:uncharacterized protein LOC141914862 n=1 Tax=Tubulanus polymorphus TaxID=672921 RepID=UPI003DA56427
MAASCLGAFGAYKYAYSSYKNGLNNYESNNAAPKHSDTVWVNKRYIPTDLRSTAPVARHKPLAPPLEALPRPAGYWIPPSDASLRAYDRGVTLHISSPATRCEEWSTLRQIYPSRGHAQKSAPPSWGTGQGLPPSMSAFPPTTRFPHINSPMTRYVDDMHSSNRLFKLH